MKREPVILVNCSRSWQAQVAPVLSPGVQASWTLQSLLELQGGSRAFRCDWELPNNSKLVSPELANSSEEITGSLLQEIIKQNGTIRIFDKLGRRTSTNARRWGERVPNTDKMYLFDDYSTPSPLQVQPIPSLPNRMQGTDRFARAGLLTDYQWVIVSHK